MNHLILLLICILSIELLIRSNIYQTLKQIVDLIRSVLNVIKSSTISDHWKEVIIPRYSINLMRLSSTILVTLFLIILIFVITNIFFNKLLLHTFSLVGILETIFYGISYVYLRRIYLKWIIIIFFKGYCIGWH